MGRPAKPAKTGKAKSTPRRPPQRDASPETLEAQKQEGRRLAAKGPRFAPALTEWAEAHQPAFYELWTDALLDDSDS